MAHEKDLFRVEITRKALKDIENLSPKLKKKLREILLNRIAVDPYSGKKLVGDLTGYRSIRLNLQDRIVYRIDEDKSVIYILRARSHYEKL